MSPLLNRMAPVLITVLFASAAIATQTETQPHISATDRIRLAEAFRLADQLGDQVWPDWTQAPFAVLLVTPETEFLMRHPKPSADFTKLGHDALLKSDIYYRKRNFDPGFLATFPAVPGSMISTIVVGQAENTWVKTSTLWVITLLHEHFHQLQDSQPNFYADVNALGLAKGDQTGMWMLNYAFPYEKKEVQEQFVAISKLLSEALKTNKRDRVPKVRAYLDARRQFQAMLAADDYKYLSFQFWKEGIARYTEIRMGRLAATKFRASKSFRALPDYKSFADVAQSTSARTMKQLENQKLGESKREVAYSYGASEAMLLDLTRPGWQQKYFVEKFDLGKYW